MDETKYAISKPVVIIASRANLEFSKHRKLFRRNGMECLQVTDRFKLIEESIKPSCFCVFMDDNFCKESTRVLQELRKHSKAAWVFCLRDQFGKVISHQAMAAGAALVLFRPTDPEQYLLRAKQMLAVFESSRKVAPESKPVVKVVQKAPVSLQSTKTDEIEDLIQEEVQQEPVVEKKAKRLSSASLISDKERPIFQKSFKTLEQKVDYPERRPAWDGYAQSYVRGPFESLEVLKQNHKTLLKKLLKDIGMGNISLFSVRAQSPLDHSFQKVRVIAGNDINMSFSKELSISTFPELRYCVDQKLPVFVYNADESVVYDAKPRAKRDLSLAALPIIDVHKNLLGVLRVSFPVETNLSLQSFLEDLSGFAAKLDVGFKTLDFFSRIYSEDCSLYERPSLTNA
ncbi:hypothetical protein GW915_01510 [bacterium]|nr:hypothetical protein [bacterium]